LESAKKIYFASDFHLGVPTHKASRSREDSIVKWLEMASEDAYKVFLVGDIFDFWFEYKHAIPKGFIRLQGKLAQMVDAGIEVIFFIGNHDMWMFDYFEKEIGVKIYRKEQSFDLMGTHFFIGHGDGLGPGDKGYKFLKKVFANKFCQWCFARLHPNLGIGMADFWSRKSRGKEKEPQVFLGEENEWLVTYCKEKCVEVDAKYFVFGHRHLPIDYDLPNGSKYINLGDWINHRTYAVFDGETLKQKKWEQ
jgi:UDP-2,3-diacylglucosamine hydrolase